MASSVAVEQSVPVSEADCECASPVYDEREEQELELESLEARALDPPLPSSFASGSRLRVSISE